MSKKLEYLTMMSLNKKMKTKWFLIANLIICVLVVGLINIDGIIKFFGGDFDEKTNIIVIDNTNYVYSDFENIYNSSISYMEDMIDTSISLSKDNIDKVKEELEDNDIILVIDNDSNNFLKAELIVNNKIDTILFQFINSSLNSVKTNVALNYYGIDSEKLALIESPVEVTKTSLEEDSVDEDSEFLIGTIFPIILLPVFMLIIFLVQMIGAEINEEKSTKSMEIIISNVSPSVHFTSKLLAGNIFVLTQGLLLIGYLFVGVFARFIFNKGNLLGDTSFVTDITSSLSGLGITDKLSSAIPLTLVLMIVTFVAYSLLAGILASVTTNMEDFQQTQTPIVMISLVGFYLTMMATMFDGSMFIRIMSYIPFISALLSPALFVLGQVSVIDMCISIITTIVVVLLLYKYGLRIYKVGILNYSSSDLWKKMFNAIKNK